MQRPSSGNPSSGSCILIPANTSHHGAAAIGAGIGAGPTRCSVGAQMASHRPPMAGAIPPTNPPSSSTGHPPPGDLKNAIHSLASPRTDLGPSGTPGFYPNRQALQTLHYMAPSSAGGPQAPPPSAQPPPPHSNVVTAAGAPARQQAWPAYPPKDPANQPSAGAPVNPLQPGGGSSTPGHLPFMSPQRLSFQGAQTNPLNPSHHPTSGVPPPPPPPPHAAIPRSTPNGPGGSGPGTPGHPPFHPAQHQQQQQTQQPQHQPFGVAGVPFHPRVSTQGQPQLQPPQNEQASPQSDALRSPARHQQLATSPTPHSSGPPQVTSGVNNNNTARPTTTSIQPMPHASAPPLYQQQQQQPLRSPSKTGPPLSARNRSRSSQPGGNGAPSTNVAAPPVAPQTPFRSPSISLEPASPAQGPSGNPTGTISPSPNQGQAHHHTIRNLSAPNPPSTAVSGPARQLQQLQSQVPSHPMHQSHAQTVIQQQSAQNGSSANPLPRVSSMVMGSSSSAANLAALNAITIIGSSGQSHHHSSNNGPSNANNANNSNKSSFPQRAGAAQMIAGALALESSPPTTNPHHQSASSHGGHSRTSSAHPVAATSTSPTPMVMGTSTPATKLDTARGSRSTIAITSPTSARSKTPVSHHGHHATNPVNAAKQTPLSSRTSARTSSQHPQGAAGEEHPSTPAASARGIGTPTSTHRSAHRPTHHSTSGGTPSASGAKSLTKSDLQTIRRPYGGAGGGGGASIISSSRGTVRRDLPTPGSTVQRQLLSAAANLRHPSASSSLAPSLTPSVLSSDNNTYSHPSLQPRTLTQSMLRSERSAYGVAMNLPPRIPLVATEAIAQTPRDCRSSTLAAGTPVAKTPESGALSSRREAVASTSSSSGPARSPMRSRSQRTKPSSSTPSSSTTTTTTTNNNLTLTSAALANIGTPLATDPANGIIYVAAQFPTASARRRPPSQHSSRCSSMTSSAVPSAHSSAVSTNARNSPTNELEGLQPTTGFSLPDGIPPSSSLHSARRGGHSSSSTPAPLLDVGGELRVPLDLPGVENLPETPRGLDGIMTSSSNHREMTHLDLAAALSPMLSSLRQPRSDRGESEIGDDDSDLDSDSDASESRGDQSTLSRIAPEPIALSPHFADAGTQASPQQPLDRPVDTQDLSPPATPAHQIFGWSPPRTPGTGDSNNNMAGRESTGSRKGTFPCLAIRNDEVVPACPQCGVSFENEGTLAMTLDCQHTFCAECADKMRDKDNQVTCRQCKRRSNASNLRHNFAVNGLVGINMNDLNQIDNILDEFGATCPVCLDNFTKNVPLMLTCGHSLCEQCVELMVEHKRNLVLECPQCRTETDLTQGRFVNVSLQRTIKHILELRSRHTSISSSNSAASTPSISSTTKTVVSGNHGPTKNKSPKAPPPSAPPTCYASCI